MAEILEIDTSLEKRYMYQNLIGYSVLTILCLILLVTMCQDIYFWQFITLTSMLISSLSLFHFFSHFFPVKLFLNHEFILIENIYQNKKLYFIDINKFHIQYYYFFIKMTIFKNDRNCHTVFMLSEEYLKIIINFFEEKRIMGSLEYPTKLSYKEIQYYLQFFPFSYLIGKLFILVVFSSLILSLFVDRF